MLARQVTHTNVIRIHDLGEIDGIKYITMPFVQGTDLARLLEDRRARCPSPRAGDRPADRIGAARRARSRRRPSRSEAREHPHRRRGSRRSSPTSASPDRPTPGHDRDRGRRDRRHARLHGAGTGDGQACRSARRHLRVRFDRVRDARSAAGVAEPAATRALALLIERSRQAPAAAAHDRSVHSGRHSTGSSRAASSPIPRPAIRRRRMSRPRSIGSTPKGTTCVGHHTPPPPSQCPRLRRGLIKAAGPGGCRSRRRRQSRVAAWYLACGRAPDHVASARRSRAGVGAHRGLRQPGERAGVRGIARAGAEHRHRRRVVHHELSARATAQTVGASIEAGVDVSTQRRGRAWWPRARASGL